MIEFMNPNEDDLHTGTAIEYDDSDCFAIRTWKSFSKDSDEYDSNDTFWVVDRESGKTFLILFRKRTRMIGWHTFTFGEFKKYGEKLIIPNDHIREARRIAKELLDMRSPYRRIDLTTRYGENL